MSINLFRTIVFYVSGDGSSTVFDIDLSSAPVSILPDGLGSTAGVTQPGFDFRVSPPIAVQHISVSDPANPGSTATATLARKVLTVTLSAAPDNAMNPVQIAAKLAF